MDVHLKGGDIGNRGDVLMLKTVLDRLSKSYRKPNVSAYNYYVPLEMRIRMGLRQTLWFPNYLRLSGLIGYPILKRYRETLGLTLPREIDWVFDLSGFCYTDTWDAENSISMRNYLNRQREFGTKYVMLPQAFGPFREPKTAEAFTAVANEASLLFVRDDRSREYIEDLRIDTSIAKAPDITTVAPTEVPSWCEKMKSYICVVPNSRMVEEKKGDARESYLQFLVQVCESLDRQDAKVLFLLFESRDRDLLSAVSKALGREVLYVEEGDPVRLRGIIGGARGVVASRYHALVSALSQGVVALGTSWSHKYEELFRDYGCADLLIPSVGDTQAVRERLDVLLHSTARVNYEDRIEVHASEMRDRAEEMWSQIGEVTGLSGLDRFGDDIPSNSPKEFTPPER